MNDSITIFYKKMFTEEEVSIISDYLDTKEGQQDNNVASYIKINIKSLLSFIKEKRKFCNEIEDEFIEYIKRLSQEYSLLRIK